MGHSILVYNGFDFVFSTHADSFHFFDNGASMAFVLNGEIVACLASRLGDSLSVYSLDHKSNKVYRASDFSLDYRLTGKEFYF